MRCWFSRATVVSRLNFSRSRCHPTLLSRTAAASRRAVELVAEEACGLRRQRGVVAHRLQPLVLLALQRLPRQSRVVVHPGLGEREKVRRVRGAGRPASASAACIAACVAALLLRMPRAFAPNAWFCTDLSRGELLEMSLVACPDALMPAS